MRYSKAFIPTTKEVPKDATMPSHILLLRGGYIRPVGAGIYEFLPLGIRVLQNIASVVREELDRAGAQEILMPALLPSEYFEESGRWETFVPPLMRIKDRKGGDYHLAPTHEEVITDLVRRHVKSYKALPLTLYQIQMKYRDEPRPRAGLLRCREFLMKDAYSFDVSNEAAQRTYEAMLDVYHRIFTRLGLEYRVVDADSGAMGGSKSAEFQILAQTGEDSIFACEKCDFAANVEVAKSTQQGDPCPSCGAPLRSFRGIEGGHVFVLGTHYSDAMNATFVDADGKDRPFVMGCYGIGISRLVASSVEQNHDENGIRWPVGIAPYQVLILSLGRDEAVLQAAERLYQELSDADVPTLFDDRDERAGVKFKDGDLLGIPLQVTVGKRSLEDDSMELKVRGAPDGEQIPRAEIAAKIRRWIHELERS